MAKSACFEPEIVVRAHSHGFFMLSALTPGCRRPRRKVVVVEAERRKAEWQGPSMRGDGHVEGFTEISYPFVLVCRVQF